MITHLFHENAANVFLGIWELVPKVFELCSVLNWGICWERNKLEGARYWGTS